MADHASCGWMTWMPGCVSSRHFFRYSLEPKPPTRKMAYEEVSMADVEDRVLLQTLISLALG